MTDDVKRALEFVEETAGHEPYHTPESILAAEVRRLKAENAKLRDIYAAAQEVAAGHVDPPDSVTVWPPIRNRPSPLDWCTAALHFRAQREAYAQASSGLADLADVLVDRWLEARADTRHMDEAIELLEDTANLLRGMAFDPRVPGEVKAVMRSRAQKIDAFTDDAPGEKGGA